jgi:hypothetical protein
MAPTLQSLFIDVGPSFTRGKEKRPAVHLTCIGDIDGSGTSMLINSKGLNLISPIKKKKKKSHPPDRH